MSFVIFILALSMLGFCVDCLLEEEVLLPTRDTAQQLEAQQESEAYLKAGMEEIELFLASSLSVVRSQDTKRQTCGCASLGEACNICAPHFFSMDVEK
jgi:hypothetical protein